MKSNVFVLLAALVGAACSQAVGQIATPQPPVDTPVPPASSGGALRLVGLERASAGVHPIGEWATHSRTVENTSGWTATLRVVQSSCPCVNVTIQPEEILPAGQATVQLRAPVAAVAGTQEHWAVIEAALRNDSGDMVARERFGVGVTYQADLSLLVKPNRLWIAAIEGREVERVVYIRSRSLDALNIRDIRVNIEEMRVKRLRRFTVPAEERPGEEALAVTVAGVFSKPGLAEGGVSFKTDDPRFADVTVPIQVCVRDRWIAEPAGFPLVFGDLDGLVEQSVRVFARDGHRCPALSAQLRDEAGSLMPVEGITVNVARNDDGNGVIVSLRAEPGRIVATEGVGTVALLDEEGNVVRAIPVAWVKPLPPKKDERRP